MNKKPWPIHGKILGLLVMIGFGSTGKGVLHLLERHFEFDRARFVVIDPDDEDCRRFIGHRRRSFQVD